MAEQFSQARTELNATTTGHSELKIEFARFKERVTVYIGLVAFAGSLVGVVLSAVLSWALR
jgi:hypothetical protein